MTNPPCCVPSSEIPCFWVALECIRCWRVKVVFFLFFLFNLTD